MEATCIAIWTVLNSGDWLTSDSPDPDLNVVADGAGLTRHP